MTFQQFKASGRDVSDLGAYLKDDSLAGVPGRIYCGALYVEDAGAGRWRTAVGNREHHSDSLESVERPLYEFALSEGYTA